MQEWTLRLVVYVRPNAQQTSVGGIFDADLVIEVRTTARQGRAADSVLHALADALNLEANRVTFTRGLEPTKEDRPRR